MASRLTNKNFEDGKAAVEREEYDQARAFFEVAIEEDCVPALTYLASKFERGLGVDVNPSKSLELVLAEALEQFEGYAHDALAQTLKPNPQNLVMNKGATGGQVSDNTGSVVSDIQQSVVSARGRPRKVTL